MLQWGRNGGNALWKIPMNNDDDRAQQAILTTLFHWGLHGWVVYIVVAVALAVVCYRWNMPLTMRNAFYPLLGGAVQVQTRVEIAWFQHVKLKYDILLSSVDCYFNVRPCTTGT